VSPRVTLLLFGVGVGVGLICASPVLIRPRDHQTGQAGTAESTRRPSPAS
jgi:hypothetical protein